ncbi:hypothetical protein [Algirhabdus cladophorae]|uniref:hypothetical protein n=1 Tax=Algirhabdus cladophorae TaxID=3377108 RepID=UPI003B84A3A7
MPATSGGRVLSFGVGAILGPLIVGWAMHVYGPYAFWLILTGIFAVVAAGTWTAKKSDDETNAA